MLNEILTALKNGPQAPQPTSIHGNVTQIAAAALLVEAARLDRDFDESERKTISGLIQTHFHVSSEEADTILTEAERQQKSTFEDWTFTKAVNQGFNADQRKELVHALWQVAYADGSVHTFENAMIERVSKELGVSPADVEAARAAAETGK